MAISPMKQWIVSMAFDLRFFDNDIPRERCPRVLPVTSMATALITESAAKELSQVKYCHIQP